VALASEEVETTMKTVNRGAKDDDILGQSFWWYVRESRSGTEHIYERGETRLGLGIAEPTTIPGTV
jgi:hypothetical protein